MGSLPFHRPWATGLLRQQLELQQVRAGKQLPRMYSSGRRRLLCSWAVELKHKGCLKYAQVKEDGSYAVGQLSHYIQFADQVIANSPLAVVCCYFGLLSCIVILHQAIQ
jgi:hypothetical protein